MSYLDESIRRLVGEGYDNTSTKYECYDSRQPHGVPPGRTKVGQIPDPQNGRILDVYEVTGPTAPVPATAPEKSASGGFLGTRKAKPAASEE